jgi:hypothetical protein
MANIKINDISYLSTEAESIDLSIDSNEQLFIFGGMEIIWKNSEGEVWNASCNCYWGTEINAWKGIPYRYTY